MILKLIPPVTTCQVCGKRPVQGKEHVPPKHVGNVGPVRIWELLGCDGEARLETRTSPDGYWLPALCTVCNNRLGSRYVTAFGHFMEQFRTAPKVAVPGGRVFLRLKDVYPLRVLKQVYCMFLATAPFPVHSVWDGIRRFVRNRNARLSGTYPSLYLYYNSSCLGRIAPCRGIGEFASHRFLYVTEISWPPVGLVLSFEYDDRLALMPKVDCWQDFAFDEKADVELLLPVYKVEAWQPLAFVPPDQADRDDARFGRVYLCQMPDSPGPHRAVSTLVTGL